MILVAVVVGGDRRIGLLAVQRSVDDKFFRNRINALNFSSRICVERVRIGDEIGVVGGCRRLITDFAPFGAIVEEVADVVGIVSSLARFRQVRLDGEAARLNFRAVVRLERVGVFMFPRDDERTVVADGDVRTRLVRAARAVQDDVVPTVANDVPVFVDDEIGDFNCIDAEDRARLFDGDGRGIDAVVVRAVVLVFAGARVLTNNVGVRESLARLRRVRGSGNDERLLIGEPGSR